MTAGTRFSAAPPASIVDTAVGGRPKPYPKGLQLAISASRPHCLARDRLRLWLPHRARSLQTDEGQTVGDLSDRDLERILGVVTASWAQNTRETYGAGLLTFHVFCDSRHVVEAHRGPASRILILSFLAGCAGMYAGATLSNYIAGVHAWHTLHGLAWNMEDDELKAMLKGAEKLAPPSSKRPKRAPVTTALIIALRAKLVLTDPLDAAVFACLTTTFFTVARLGEFLVPTLTAFRPSDHVKPSDIKRDQDRDGREVTIFHLPRTKMAPSTLR